MIEAKIHTIRVCTSLVKWGQTKTQDSRSYAEVNVEEK